MSNWEIAKLILYYSFWTTIFIWFSIAVIVRVVLDYIAFFTSWFRYKPEKVNLQKYVLDAIRYDGPFKDRVMAKALLRLARDVDSLKDKLE
ncbi:MULTISPECIES: hypothetical protein [Leptospira]|uniref:hypothetical protein n=1 Tax=Leptospira TaxID=171 RepID=UPI0007740C69|nr:MULTISPECIES: hypothetical protein [Leptospira]MDI7196324.1 hypothetical protein [Leptospira santarosai]MDI7202104.1 hypothetical protein [Leptospira santarosai]UOG58998.1 hypothetical protein MAL07_09105 [Leptospira noguchii]